MKQVYGELLSHIWLCFAGAPGDMHAEVSLRYLGAVEISEDATLEELKSQVRLVPAPDLSSDLAASSEILTRASISFSLTHSLF